MAKNVFRPQEINVIMDRVVIEPPMKAEPELAPVEAIEEYNGPTADDLRREAELFRKSFEVEKTAMITQTREEADQIIKDAEKKAFEEVKRKTDEAAQIRQEASDEAERIIREAEARSAEELARIEAEVEEIRKKATKEGFDSGREEGFSSGKEEAARLIEVLHTVIDKTIEKRAEIISESETQLINLVLLIAKKVIKVISENQKNVVINNVIQALRKLKTRGDVVIRVNLADVELTSEHIKDFMRMVENVRSITVLEDSTVDKGGCIIETDFGHIDARIASQLGEIEEKILELVPIKTKEK